MSAGPFVSEADYVALSHLVIEHGWRTDQGRAGTVHELYVEDGELVLPGLPLKGREAIRDWGRQLDAAPPWRSIRHVCGNMRFTADGEDGAEGSTVLTMFMTAREGPATTLPWSVGEDHDRFARTDGWRFVRREWVELFARGDAVALT